jgi:hypothetical protein
MLRRTTRFLRRGHLHAASQQVTHWPEFGNNESTGDNGRDCTITDAARLQAMKTYSFYDRDTGIFTGEKLLSNNLIDRQVPEGCSAIEGDFDPLSERLDLTDYDIPIVVSYVPPRPDAGFEWHADVTRWKVSDVVQARIDARAVALRRIGEIESAQPRTLREFALGFAGAAERLKAMDDEITALRKDL